MCQAHRKRNIQEVVRRVLTHKGLMITIPKDCWDHKLILSQLKYNVAGLPITNSSFSLHVCFVFTRLQATEAQMAIQHTLILPLRPLLEQVGRSVSCSPAPRTPDASTVSPGPFLLPSPTVSRKQIWEKENPAHMSKI